MALILLNALLCAVFIASTVDGQAPVVKIMNTDPPTYNRRYISATKDQDIILDCFVENLPSALDVRWRRTVNWLNGTKLISLSQDMALDDNIHYSIERPTTFTWRLRVRSAQLTDDGTYQCYVQTSLNSVAKDDRVIKVHSRPYLDLQLTSSDTSVTEGEDLDLTCYASAEPPPDIMWTRLGGALLPIGQEKKMGPLLQLKNIQAADRGVYRCKAENPFGMDKTDIKLNVRFKPVIEVPREVIHQAPGYRVELQCLVDANPHPRREQCAWVFGATTFTTSSKGYEVRFLQGAFGQLIYELIIYCVDESNYGEYACRFKNVLSTGGESKTIVLAGTDTPQKSVKVGKVIKCSAACLSRSPLLVLFSCLLVLLVRTGKC